MVVSEIDGVILVAIQHKEDNTWMCILHSDNTTVCLIGVTTRYLFCSDKNTSTVECLFSRGATTVGRISPTQKKLQRLSSNTNICFIPDKPTC